MKATWSERLKSWAGVAVIVPLSFGPAVLAVLVVWWLVSWLVSNPPWDRPVPPWIKILFISLAPAALGAALAAVIVVEQLIWLLWYLFWSLVWILWHRWTRRGSGDSSSPAAP